MPDLGLFVCLWAKVLPCLPPDKTLIPWLTISVSAGASKSNLSKNSICSLSFLSKVPASLPDLSLSNSLSEIFNTLLSWSGCSKLSGSKLSPK